MTHAAEKVTFRTVAGILLVSRRVGVWFNASNSAVCFERGRWGWAWRFNEPDGGPNPRPIHRSLVESVKHAKIAAASSLLTKGEVRIMTNVDLEAIAARAAEVDYNKDGAVVGEWLQVAHEDVTALIARVRKLEAENERLIEGYEDRISSLLHSSEED